MNKEFLWTEIYRPKKVADCILPDRIKTLFQAHVDQKEIPNLLLTGGPGTGKTTVAMAMCEEIGLNYLFINSSKDRGIDTLRTKIVNFASTISLTGGRKVIILDEADSITGEAQSALRGTIEEFSKNCTFIFTCNFESKIMDAIKSRCMVYNFNFSKQEKEKMDALFFKRVKAILKNEEIEYEPAAVVKIITIYSPDYRAVINELQRYGKYGSIDAGVVAQIASVTRLDDLAEALKEKDFRKLREWVAKNSDVGVNIIFKKLYSTMYEYFAPESIPYAVVLLAKYQYQAAFVADQEINLVACLTELMANCEFK